MKKQRKPDWFDYEADYSKDYNWVKDEIAMTELIIAALIILASVLIATVFI